MMRTLGLQLTEKEITELLEEVDEDGSGPARPEGWCVFSSSHMFVYVSYFTAVFLARPRAVSVRSG